MIFFVIILLFIVLKSAKIASPNEFMTDYMSRERTNAVKGIFVILIIFSHASQYMNLGGAYDEPYMILKSHLNQMVVSMFFFYSGYGMMKSILSKKFEYIRKIPTKRLLVVLINFDIAVGLFVLMYFLLGKTFDISTILLSLIGWESVGNSNWYMFAIFVVYILMFLSYYILRWFDQKPAYYISTVIFTLLTMLFVYWEMRMGQPSWCYNTVILFPLGCWYALLQKPVEKIMMRNDYIYSFLCAGLGVIYYMSFQHRWSGGIERYTIWAVAFTLVVVCFTMKVSITSKTVLWFGEHVFSVYILQRIPMIILSHFGVAAESKYMFLTLSILMTIFLALVFDYCVGKLDQKIVRA